MKFEIIIELETEDQNETIKDFLDISEHHLEYFSSLYANFEIKQIKVIK